MVQVDEHRTFLAGGKDGLAHDFAYMFDWRTGAWTQLPSMSGERWAKGILAPAIISCIQNQLLFKKAFD